MLNDDVSDPIQWGMIKKGVYFFHPASGSANGNDVLVISWRHGNTGYTTRTPGNRKVLKGSLFVRINFLLLRKWRKVLLGRKKRKAETQDPRPKTQDPRSKIQDPRSQSRKQHNHPPIFHSPFSSLPNKNAKAGPQRVARLFEAVSVTLQPILVWHSHNAGW